MKRRLKTLIPVILVAVMLVGALAVFAGLAVAAGESDSTLATCPVTYHSSNGYVTTHGTTTTVKGDLATLLSKVASLAPTTTTEYTITLAADATLTTPVTLSLNEMAEVRINLNGYTLTTATDGDAITVTGAGTLRMLGGYDALGNRGKVVYQQTSGAILAVADGSAARATFRGIDADVSAMESGAALKAQSGELVVQHVTVASDKAIKLVEASDATVSVKSSRVTLPAGTAVYADATNVYVQETVINAAVGIDTVGAAHVLSVGADIKAESPYRADNSVSTVYVLGGVIETTGTKIVSGTHGQVGFYYGSGDMRVIGEDPANYSTQSNCTFADKDNVWVLSYTGSAKAGMITKATLGSAPSVSYKGASDSFSLNTAGGAFTMTAETIHILTFLSDYTVSSKPSQFQGTEYFNAIIDLNGHDVTMSYAKSWNLDFYGNHNTHFDGADMYGNKGQIIVKSPGAMIVRCRIKAKESAGANDHTTVTYTDIELVASGWTDTATPFICIQRGEMYADNLTVRYTNEASSITAASIFKVINAGSSGAPDGARVMVRNSSIINESPNNYVTLKGFDLSASSKSDAYADNLTLVDSGYVGTIPSGCTAVIKNSDLETKAAAFAEAGNISIYDTVIRIKEGSLSSSANPTFYYGTGKNEIIVEHGAGELTGSYKTEDGSALIMKETGRYVIMKSDDIVSASITMPAIFANNMVLQRNKEINIFGYCDTVGATVEVKLAGETATAVVDENGEWCATLPPMGAMFNQTLEVRQTGNVAYNLKRFTGVNIGEIWVMSGQSNGDLQTMYMEDLSEYYDLAASRSNIRMYRSSQSYSVTEQKIGSGTWYEGTAANIASKSNSVTAIGYVMATKLADELGPDVPIAIMHMVRGSCKIKTWIDYDHIKEISPSATREYEYWLEQNSLPSSAHGGGAVATVMYNNVIAPVYGFEVAGVLWYQGEGDTGGGYFGSTNSSFRISGEAEDADNNYTEFFYALEDTFREAFGNDPTLPFYVMQLSPFLSSSYDTSNVYELKMEQYEMCKNEPNTHLVTLGLDGAVLSGSFFDGNLDPDMGSTSVSGQGFIHPARKSTVGIRTADLILANEYGIKYTDVYTYPTPIKATAANGVVTVEFDTELRYMYGESVMGFEIYDGSKWVAATGTIDGNKVIISAEGVSDPKSVRYGCGEMVMELGDGTLIEVWDTKNTYGTGKKNYTRSGTTLTVVYNGVTYTIEGNTTDMVRSLDYGNITNISGVPTPIFEIEIQ